MKIGIAGLGVVGSAVYNAINDDVEKVVYDPPLGFDNFTELSRCTVIFAALPTPKGPDGALDFTIYAEFLGMLKKVNYGSRGEVLVIKSTVTWQKIGPYFDALPIVMNPEFLKAASSYEDMMKQDIILGGRMDRMAKVRACYEQCFKMFCRKTCGGIVLDMPAPGFILTKPQVAIAIKYTNNVWEANQVLFWEWCQETFGCQREVFKILTQLKGWKPELMHAQVGMDGTRGYGGACFPKDVAAINEARPHEYTAAMEAMNARLRGEA